MRGVVASPVTDEGARWRELIDHLPALVAYWSSDLRNVVANAAYLRWFGLEPHQVHGMHIRDVLGSAVFAANLPYIEGALAGERQHFERTLLTATGETRHTQAEYIPHVTEAGVDGFYVLVADITEKVEAQRDLLAAQELARMGSYTFEPASEQLQLSAELKRLLGLAEDQPGPSVEEYVSLVHPDDAARVAEVRERAREGQEYETTYRIVRPDGDVRHVHSRTSAVRAPDGSVALLRGVMQDETEIRRLAGELGVANRSLSDLIGMLGHDLSQPIAVTSGYLEHVDEEWESLTDEERRGLVGRSRAASERVRRLLADILALVDADASGLRTRPVAVDVATALGASREGAPVDFEVVASAAGRALVDPLHLDRVVANLLGNAGRHGRPPFVVDVVHEGDEVVLSVRDHGEGVPEAFVPHLFERFARASGDASVPGTGFGLYLVAQLVRANHGSVRHRRPEEGPGAVFEVRLPAAGREPA